MKSKSNPLLRSSRLVIVAITLGPLPALAGTTWDGEGGAVTDINLADNWDGTAPGVVNSLTGTTAATFGTGGSSATMNVDGYFTTLTFNRNDASGFTVNGPQVLSVKHSTSGSTVNFNVVDTAGNGVTTINAPFQVNTSAVATRVLTIANLEAGTVTPSLVFTNTVSASTPANTYGFRFGGAGTTKISGAISHTTGIQQTFTTTFGTNSLSGRVIIAGNQALGAAPVNISTTSNGLVASTARIEMGETTADVQSWASTTVNQASTVAINSTATLTGTVAICNTTSSVTSGGIVEVNGNLSATTLSIGSSANTATLKVGGTATFSGVISTGATVGNKIVGNALSNGTLNLSSGTINGASTTIGGAGNENKLNLVKQTSGILNITGGTHPYTGTTTVNGGTLNVSGSLTSSPVTVNAGGTIGGEGTLGGGLNFAAGISTISFDPTTQTGSLVASAVDVSADAAIIMSPTAALTNDTSYVVLKRSTGTFSAGDLARFVLPTRGGSKSLTGGDTEITLTPSASASAALVWKGNVSSAWDIATTQNWTNGGSPDRFYSDDAVTFDDTATSFAVAVATAVTAGNLVFNNATPNTYTFSGSGIGGSGSITKNGSGLVTLPNALSTTGGIDVNAGTLDLGNSANKTFTGGINIDGGELQFASTIAGSLNAQAVTLAGGTINYKGTTTITNDATQTFNITTNGSGIRMDTTAAITWRIGGKVSGAGNFVKSGAGVLSLGTATDASNNDFTGSLTVTAGMLDIRNGDSLGATSAGTVIQDATLMMQNFGQAAGTIVVKEPLSFSGNAFLTSYCQEAKAFTNEFKGAVTVAVGTTLGLATARTGTNTPPTLELNGSTITTGAGSILSFGSRPPTYPAGSAASAQTVNVGSAITGPGAVIAAGDAGSVYTLSAPGYSGNTTVSSGTLKLGAVNANNEASTVTVAAGAKIDIAFSGDDTVAALVLGVTSVGPGTYNSSHPIYGAFFDATSTGSIVVPAASSCYSAWQLANAPGQTVDQDHDNDGVVNGIEYFMGLSGTAFTANPAVVSGVVTWPMGTTYSGVYNADYVVQTSSNLSTWTPATIGVGAGFVAITPGVSVTYTLPAGSGKLFVRLLVNPN